MFRTITTAIVDELKSIVGHYNVLTDEESLNLNSEDETEDLHFTPDVIVIPGSAQEISQILKLANRHMIPVTPRGGGTGLSGGALAVHGGICLSLGKMNRIIEIDEKNFQAVVEPG